MKRKNVPVLYIRDRGVLYPMKVVFGLTSYIEGKGENDMDEFYKEL
ncbi:hypothetical protein [Oceanobacillus senegalensis]|nr:hypothetical protein [Oceanobacillus senegalensis]